MVAPGEENTRPMATGNHKERAPRSWTSQAGNGRRDIFNPSGDGAEAGFGVSPCSCSSGDELSEAKQNMRLKNIGCRDPGPGL